jgi:preprotein translocase subunit SecG
MTILLGILTFLLVLVSLFMVLVILAQRTKSDGGVGAGLGGGVTEAAFGAESGNVLTTSTQVAAVAFFVLSFALFLGHIHEHHKTGGGSGSALPGASEFAPAPTENPATTPEDTPAAPLPENPSVPAPSNAAPAPDASSAAPSSSPAAPTAPQPAVPAPAEPAQPTP